MTPVPPTDTAAGLIYVLLPVHNRREVTEGFVRGLMAQTDQRFHLVLIDDGSTDGSSDAVLALLPDSTVLRGHGGWWWAGSLHEGYRWLMSRQLNAGDLVLIANDDTDFDETFLANARSILASRPRSLLLAQLMTTEWELIEVGVRVNWSKLSFKGVQDPGKANCFSTRGLFMHAEDFVDLGGFHRRLLPHYLSDYEFTIRARRRGFELVSDASVRLRFDATTTGIRTVSKTDLRSYLRTTLSIKATSNPVFMSTFLLLACPKRHLPRNLFRVWRRFAAGALAAAR